MRRQSYKRRFDCSARFYPIIATKKYQSLFHLSATLDCAINPLLLEEAGNRALGRFPYFAVGLKRGFGWYSLEECSDRVAVERYDGTPLVPLPRFFKGGLLFRLSAAGAEVHLDFFHGLSDAHGAMAYLTAVLTEYRRLQGADVPEYDLPAPTAAEEDAFETYYKKTPLGKLKLGSMLGKSPLVLRGTLLKTKRSIAISTDSAAILDFARGQDASVTEATLGLLAHQIAALCPNEKKPIVMMVPINLRGQFPSETLLNFVLFERVVLPANSGMSEEEFVREAKRQLRQDLKQSLFEQLCTTVKGVRIASAVPLFLKRFFVKLGRLFARSRQTIIVSNLGRVSLPEGLGVEELQFNLNVSNNNVCNLGMLSFKGRARFAFTSCIEEDDLPVAFGERLKSITQN